MESIELKDEEERRILMIQKQFSIFDVQDSDDEVKKSNKSKIVEIMKGSFEFFEIFLIIFKMLTISLFFCL